MMYLTTTRLMLKPLTYDNVYSILELVNSSLWILHISQRNTTISKYALAYIHSLYQNDQKLGLQFV